MKLNSAKKEKLLGPDTQFVLVVTISPYSTCTFLSTLQHFLQETYMKKKDQILHQQSIQK